MFHPMISSGPSLLEPAACPVCPVVLGAVSLHIKATLEHKLTLPFASLSVGGMGGMGGMEGMGGMGGMGGMDSEYSC
jgi:hypothetical protein